MLKKTVIEYFGNNQSAVARAVGINRNSVWGWPELIPEKQAMRLERITKGELKYDESLYRKDKSGAAA